MPELALAKKVEWGLGSFLQTRRLQGLAVFASLPACWALFSGTAAVHNSLKSMDSLDGYFLSCLNALCPHHPLLSPRGKEEQADELGKSQPRLGSLNTVSIYALELTLYTFLP